MLKTKKLWLKLLPLPIALTPLMSISCNAQTTEHENLKNQKIIDKLLNDNKLSLQEKLDILKDKIKSLGQYTEKVKALKQAMNDVEYLSKFEKLMQNTNLTTSRKQTLPSSLESIKNQSYTWSVLESKLGISYPSLSDFRNNEDVKSNVYIKSLNDEDGSIVIEINLSYKTLSSKITKIVKGFKIFDLDANNNFYNAIGLLLRYSTKYEAFDIEKKLTSNDTIDDLKNKLIEYFNLQNENNLKLSIKKPAITSTSKIIWLTHDEKNVFEITFMIEDLKNNKKSKDIKIYFKNIIKTRQHKLYDAARKIRKYDINNPFSLKGFQSDMLWDDALLQVKNAFNLDSDFLYISWKIDNKDENVEKGLNNQGINKQFIQVWDDSIPSEQKNIEVFFKNIKKTDKYRFNSVIKKLDVEDDWSGTASYKTKKYFSLSLPYGYGDSRFYSSKTHQEAFEQLKKSYRNDPDFKDLEWYVENDDANIYSGRFLSLEGTFQARAEIVLGEHRKTIWFKFKDVYWTRQHVAEYINSKLKKYNSIENGLDSKGMDDINLRSKILELLKETFDNKSNFWSLSHIYFSIPYKGRNDNEVENNFVVYNVTISDGDKKFVTEVYFKNIQKTATQTIWWNSIKKLGQITASNRINLQKFRAIPSTTWGEVINMLYDLYKDDPDLKNIQWDIEDPYKRIDQSEFYGKYYEAYTTNVFKISLKSTSTFKREIRLYFLLNKK